MQNEQKDNFAFIKEIIKDKPINKKRLLLRIFFTFVMAVIFGLVASIVFTYFQPKIQNMMYPQKDPVISIPEDDISDTQSTEEPVSEVSTETEMEDIPETEAQEEPPVMDIQVLQDLQNQLYAVGREANTFVVGVTGVKSDTDWFNNAYESRGQGSGIIIANNGRELLILTERKVIAGAQEIYVSLINGTSVSAQIKKLDGNTGITVLSVPLDSLEETDLNAISIATLGNSLLTTQGTMVIAVGSPLGTPYSILVGNITSATNNITTVDNTYSIFTTDIVGSAKGSGALINYNGEVVGLVMQDYSSSGDENTLTAVSISELKSVIEMLSNNQDIPYIGLSLATVTNDIAKSFELPKGVYIKEVSMDSPAMNAGLQSGDIIVEMDDEVIYTVDNYEKELLSIQPGERTEIRIKRQGADGYTDLTYYIEVGVLAP